MLKKILVVVLLLTISLFAFTACGGKCENHTYTDECDAVCDTDGCGYTRVAPHKWESACDGECDCGEIRTPASHVYDNACDDTCNVCGDERTAAEHIYDNACDDTCNVCGDERSVPDHVYDNGCDESCNVCGDERSVAGHNDGNDDGRCDSCGTNVSSGAPVCQNHTYTDECDAVCNTVDCGYTRVAPHKWASDCDSKCDCGEEREVSGHV